MPTEPLPHDPQNEYVLRPEDVLTGLDPELQNAILSEREGQPLPRYLCGRKEEAGEVVDVIARLLRPGAEVEGLNVSQRIGQIVTGTVAVKDIAKVRAHEDVLSLKGARPIRPTLANSVPEIRAARHQLRNNLLGLAPADLGDVNGAGVIVGIVDYGCDFAHPNFRRPDGETPGGATRILYLWDQRADTDGAAPEGYCYGREFTADDLNRALRQAPPSEEDPRAPHRHLDYALDNRHGTQVMDVAAGNGGEDRNAPGVAPAADIIFVDSSLGRDARNDASLGNSRRLLEAVKYVFDKAEKLNKRAVVNVSLNYNGGPHDGSTPVEEGFDLLLEPHGRAIVVAAGNARMMKTHVRRVVRPNQRCTLFWEVGAGDVTDNKLEVWYEGRHRLAVSLRPPDGGPLDPVLPDSTSTLLRRGEMVGRIFNRLDDSSNGDNHIVVLLDAAAPKGVWELELIPLGSRSVTPFTVHAWIERDNYTSVFSDARDEDRACTLGTLACGHSTIAVTGYHPLEPDYVPDDHAEGPTRDGKHKPEVSAPGTGLFVAERLSDTADGPQRGGTSLAAPHVTGLVALLMQTARKPLTTAETRDLVIRFARRAPASGRGVWDSRYGAGRVDASASVVACVRSHRPREEKEEPSITGVVVSSTTVEVAVLTPDTADGGGAVGLVVETQTVSVVAATPPDVSHDSAHTAAEGDGPAGGGADVDSQVGRPETERD